VRPHTAYIALGSNLGDRQPSLQRAIRLLSEVPVIGIASDGIASLYETDPVGGDDLPLFLNSVIRVATTLGPADLMAALLEVERLMGRKREGRWGSRLIDLDLLLFGAHVTESPAVTLPHPRMHERRFVLEPLAEIAGEVLHPVLGATIAELNAALGDVSDQRIVRIAGPEWVKKQWIGNSG